MKVLVLGGSGFIGSHVVDAMRARGHSIRIFDVRPDPFRGPVEGVDYFFGDLSDPASLNRALTGIDAVAHLISTSVPGTADNDPQSDVTGNLVASLNLIQAMIGQGVSRLLYVSSGGAVYGVPDVTPIQETHPLRPIGSYGIVKVAVEQYLEVYRRVGKLSPIMIRPANPYGPRQGRTGVQGAISTFMRLALEDRPVEIWGDGTVVRDFFYVTDLAELCALALESGSTGAFNAGSGVGVSINALLDSIARVTGLRILRNYRPARAVDVPTSILDIEKARAAFGWWPAVGLDEGLKTTYDWISRHKAALVTISPRI
jgi:UDP-glucose 4-epimerase